MKKNEFRIDVTEKKIDALMKYLNNMQNCMEQARDDNNASMLTAMAYRDGAIRVLTMLGINYECTPMGQTEKGGHHIEFTKISKDIYAD